MYLLMTHLAKGLYSKAIIQSGPLVSSYNYWDKNPSLYTKRFAKDIGGWFLIGAIEVIDFKACAVQSAAQGLLELAFRVCRFVVLSLSLSDCFVLFCIVLSKVNQRSKKVKILLN